MQPRQDDKSLGELFADLARDTSVLVRQEVHLATTEVTYKAARLGREVAIVAVGGLFAYAGLLALLAALIIVLAAAGLEWWLAALVVGVLVIVIGLILMQRGINSLKHADLAPHETMQTLKEDARWAKEQVS